jgi:Protein of unknown function (DUF2804)
VASTLPYRGDGTGGPADLPVPPGPMPAWYRGRPLKRWCYVGVFGPELMWCAGSVCVAGVPQTFWAAWDRSSLVERTRPLCTRGVDVSAGAVRVAGVAELTLAPAGDAVEVVSAHGRAHVWTRKTPVRASGSVTLAGRARPVDAYGLVDETAGYHARETEWWWSAGVGTTDDGRRLGWNLVSGIHDAATASERTVWVDGVAGEVGPVRFSEDLRDVAFASGERLAFAPEAVRRRRDRLVLVSSNYMQPFGVFSGQLPGGLTVAEGYGVMEHHRARW